MEGTTKIDISGKLETVRKNLENVKLREVVADDQDVLMLEHNLSVGEALRILAKRRVLSAPLVISPGLEDTEALVPGDPAPSLLGWVDINDIVRFFLKHLHEKHEQLPASMLLLMVELENEGRGMTDKMLITVMGSDDRGLVYQVDTNISILDAIKGFYLDSGGTGRVVHRVAVFNAHGEITHVVSQMDVIKYLAEKQEAAINGLAEMALSELGLGTSGRQLVTIDPHMPTLLAYELMLREGVSGAAVVNKNGELIANLSTSDLRTLQQDHLSVLALPVAEFLALLHGTSYSGYSARASGSKVHPFFQRQASAAGLGGSPMLPPASPRSSGGGSPVVPHSPRPVVSGAKVSDEVRLITCRPDSTLRELLTALVSNRVHRVYVVEPAGGEDSEAVRPVGVLTPTDVLRLIGGAAGDVDPAVRAKCMG